MNLESAASLLSPNDACRPSRRSQGAYLSTHTPLSYPTPPPPSLSSLLSVTYDDVGGAEDAIEKLREVVEMPLLHPERFVSLGIDPPKGVLLYVKNLFLLFSFFVFSVLE